MWIDERHQHILDLIATVGRIDADAVATQLQVSRETIRRDLMQLEKDGRVRRVHGGAVRLELPSEKPFMTRKRVQIEAKRRIGRTAAGLIQPGQSCFIDAGTTTAAFAQSLSRVPGIMVITNSMEVAANLRAGSASFDVVLLGGRLAVEVPATHGEMTIAEINRFRVDVAVLSPVGLHATGGVTYHEFGEAEVARVMMQNAAATMLLADHTKLGRISRATVCGCDELETLVTDAPEGQLDAYRAAGLKTLLVAR
jgi:DeoR family transcriptional regulator, fructose operon transcriptional repressor